MPNHLSLLPVLLSNRGGQYLGIWEQIQNLTLSIIGSASASELFGTQTTLLWRMLSASSSIPIKLDFVGKFLDRGKSNC